ncbi:uncharacterized protein LOC117053263 [Lacerta agilis]|uniref:uncharacterized protein LOC117053263 n=1 Tax=Lacerta agilis TaxID=80427 RepID=UPI001419D493|nr:uncharacterized protein LOC117053263 [Lacerta agilis]XP_033016765.1 uncharacterized protein LOC117053263 [Lacerta agilis]
MVNLHVRVGFNEYMPERQLFRRLKVTTNCCTKLTGFDIPLAKIKPVNWQPCQRMHKGGGSSTTLFLLLGNEERQLRQLGKCDQHNSAWCRQAHLIYLPRQSRGCGATVAAPNNTASAGYLHFLCISSVYIICMSQAKGTPPPPSIQVCLIKINSQITVSCQQVQKTFTEQKHSQQNKTNLKSFFGNEYIQHFILVFKRLKLDNIEKCFFIK